MNSPRFQLKKSLSLSQNVQANSIKVSPDITSALQKTNPELVHMFKNFLTGQIDGEYVALWHAMENFKVSASSGKSKAELTIAAQDIYDKYWSPDSDYQIFIKPKVKENLQERTDANDIDSTLFDEAATQLETECYKKFLRSDMYASFMADQGSFVRTSSPKRRVSITELFKKKETQRRSSLASFSAKHLSPLEEDEGGLNPHNIDLSKSIA
jgi:Regulator of G protein signaling domain